MSSIQSTNAEGVVPPSSSSSASAPAAVLTSDLGDINVTGSTSIVEVSDQIPPPSLDKRNLGDVLKRDFYLGGYTVTGSEVINANLLGFFNVWPLLLAKTEVAQILSPYSFMRGTMRIRVVVSCPGSCYGAMVCSAICEGGATDTSAPSPGTQVIDGVDRDNLYNSVNSTFHIINFENGYAGEFTLPFEYNKHYYEINPPAPVDTCMWRLQLQVLTPLTSTISTTAVAEIKIYGSFTDDYEVCVPRMQMKASHLEGFENKVRGKVDKKRSEINAKVTAATGGMKISDLASTVGGIAAKATGFIPALAPFTVPLAAGATAVSSIASFLGFTREATFQAPDPTVPRLFSSLSLVDGVDSGEKIVTLSGSALAVDSAIGGGENSDPLCFEAVRQRWGVISYFDISTSTIAGQVVHALPVTPFYGGKMLGLYIPTPGGYYGLPSAKWRGGMEYLIYIPSSSNLRGMIQVCYSPTHSGSVIPYAMPDPTGSLHTVSLDLCGTQQHLIQVPYSSLSLTKDSTPMTDGSSRTNVALASNGTLLFYLSSKFIAPRAGVLALRIFILARPAPDMQFSRIRTNFPGVGSLGLDSLCYQMSSGFDESVEEKSTSILSAPMDSDFNMAQSISTEVFPSARALAQKFAFIYKGTLSLPLSISTNVTGPCTAGNDGYSTTLGLLYVYDRFSWRSFYSVLFTGTRGGVRVKMMSGSSAASYPILSYITDNSTTGVTDGAISVDSGRNPHTICQVLSSERAVEVGFPYDSTVLYTNPRRIVKMSTSAGLALSDGTNRVGVLFPNFSNVITTSASRFAVATAAAEDFSVVRFRRVPALLFGPLVTA